MSYQIKVEQFEGPLDLLLRLIEQEELDITTVSLAAVTDQYLQYLNTHPDIPTEELADFLVVAAKLLLIKSRTLLPNLEAGEDEGQELERQLRMYKEFHEASKVLQKLIGRKRFLYTRDRPIVKVDRVFNPPPHLTADKLRELFVDVLSGIASWAGIQHEVIIRTISIRERIAGIHAMVAKAAKVRFKDLLSSSKTKVDVIVTFLAILELVKQRTVAVVQERMFDDIVVERVDSEDAAADTESVFTRQ